MTQPTPPPFHAGQDVALAASGQPLPPSADTQATEYQNNPFTIALDGISGVFTYVKVVGIILVVLSVLGVLGNAASSVYDLATNSQESKPAHTSTTDTPDNSPAASNEQLLGIFLIAGVFGLAAVIIVGLIATVFTGIRDVSAAAVANKEKISFGEVLSRLFQRFGGYLWLQILMNVKIFLWLLLFIIPGIIMAVRYSLAGTAFFARNMKANQALQHSTSITKNGWMTTFAAQGFFNLITLGLISGLVDLGSRAVLFRQFDAYATAGKQKPGAHLLSILFFAGYVLIVLLILAGLVALGVVMSAHHLGA